jgi:hypothetical protein
MGIALESLTWLEAEALFRGMPAPMVVLPVGTWTKEHGLHDGIVQCGDQA